MHDLGKGTTPPAQWPSHPRTRGAQRARSSPRLAQRLRVPRDYQELATLVARYHGALSPLRRAAQRHGARPARRRRRIPPPGAPRSRCCSLARPTRADAPATRMPPTRRRPPWNGVRAAAAAIRIAPEEIAQMTGEQIRRAVTPAPHRRHRRRSGVTPARPEAPNERAASAHARASSRASRNSCRSPAPGT